jgi:hypothetical protein
MLLLHIYMSQTISPVDWLQEALRWFFILDIIENTASNASGRLWTCEISFSIPSRGRNYRHLIHQAEPPSSSIIGARFNTVELYLDALRRVCYNVPDFSHFKEIALVNGRTSVPQASEWLASQNYHDMVNGHLYLSSGYLLCIVVITFSNFFLHTQIDLQDYTCAACGLVAILDQATEQLGYVWDFCNGHLG